MALTVRSEEKSRGTFSIYLEGSLDTTTYPLLEKEVDRILQDGATEIVFDLSALQYISSAGVRIVLKTHKALKKGNGKLILLHPQPQIQKVFEVINALPSIPIFASVEEMDAYLDHVQRKVLGD